MPERNITEEAADRLVEQLQEHPSEDFYVTYYERHEESERFARTLEATLRRAGWTQGSFVVVDAPVLDKNIVDVEADDEERPAVKTLVEWLDAEGFQPKFTFNPRAEEIVIYVEPQD